METEHRPQPTPQQAPQQTHDETHADRDSTIRVLPRATVLEQPAAYTGEEPYPPLSRPQEFRTWFEREGYILMRGAIPPRLCQAAVEAFRADVLGDRLGFFERHVSGKFERHQYTSAGYMKYPIMNLQDLSNRRHAAFRRASLTVLTHPAIQRAMTVLTGEAARCVHTMYFDGNQTTWAHRDGHYIDSGQDGQMIGVWVAAEDIHPDAGRFFVLPRSHRMRVPGEECDPNSAAYKARMADFVRNGPLDCVAPLLRQGDLLLWTSMVIHGSLPTLDERWSRRSLTAHYVPVSQQYKWNVRSRKSERSMRFNRVEVMLHADNGTPLARLRNQVRSEWPRIYGAVRSVWRRLTAEGR